MIWNVFLLTLFFINILQNVFVAVPPKIHAWERTLEVTAGDDLSIICEATGNPMPRVSWRKYETGKRWHSCLGLVLDNWQYVSLVSLLTVVTDYSLLIMTQCAKCFIGQMNQKPIYLHKLNVYNHLCTAISRAESDRLKNSKNLLLIVDIFLEEWKYCFNLSLSSFFQTDVWFLI